MSEDLRQQYMDGYAEAERLCNANRLTESLELYKSLLKLQPNHLPVLNNTGLVYEKLGDFQNAAEYYAKCHALAPDQPVVIHNLANSYTQLGRWTDALPLLEKIITSDIENEKNSEKYALCLFALKTKEQTRDFILSALSRYPENAVLNRLLGRALLALNSHVEGLKFLQKGAGFIEFDTQGVRYLG